jgi:hypothetical protein
MKNKGKFRLLFYFSAMLCVLISLFTYLYESRSTGWLPAISHPLRIYTFPIMLFGLILLFVGVSFHIFKRSKIALFRNKEKEN